jgi:hypothetical protein
MQIDLVDLAQQKRHNDGHVLWMMGWWQLILQMKLICVGRSGGLDL